MRFHDTPAARYPPLTGVSPTRRYPAERCTLPRLRRYAPVALSTPPAVYINAKTDSTIKTRNIENQSDLRWSTPH